MAGWFDRAAKRAASSAPSDAESGGLSRREVLARGAVVAGVAWTAPMLMATQAAASNHSTCPPPMFICGPDTPAPECCAEGEVCEPLRATDKCRPVDVVGGRCKNSGNGNCSDNSRCNGNLNRNNCNSCAEPNICGGEGAECCNAAACADGLVCRGDLAVTTGLRFCQRPCATPQATPVQSAECFTGQTCRDGFCAEFCVDDNECAGGVCRKPAGATPTTVGVCTYKEHGGSPCSVGVA